VTTSSAFLKPVATPSATSESDAGSRPRAKRFPDALAVLLGCIAVAAVATYVVPAGEYARRLDPATGRRVVVAGTFHRVSAVHVSPFAAVVAIPRGFVDAASVIALVLLAGAGLTIVERTGVLRDGSAWLIARLHGRDRLVIAVICVAFAAGGMAEGMMEEIIPLVPALLVVVARLGYPRITAVAMSAGSAAIGGAFSPMNPFNVGIAQRLAGVPLLSDSGFRIIFLVAAEAIWIWAVLRLRRDHTTAAPVDAEHVIRLSGRTATLLVAVMAAFAVYVTGVLKFGWQFEQMAAVFFVLGLFAGAIGGLGVDGTLVALTDGLRSMTSAAMLIAFARAVYLVLDDGRVIDTIVYALLLPVARLPRAGAGVAMMLAQTALHVPVPSTTGQAVLSMPIVASLADLLALPAQVAVLAYQYGAGLCELVTPTNGPVMAILAAAGVAYTDWMRFFARWYVVLLGVAAVAVIVAATGI
jgi:uncharacterized ion transporter superfamily protein YfcC